MSAFLNLKFRIYRSVFTAMRTVYRRLPFQLPFLKRTFLKKCDDFHRMEREANRDKTVIASVNGIRYELELNQMIDCDIYYSGCFEPDTTRVLNEICGEGMTVFDIGANIGCHTLLIARQVGPKGRVYAFEPMAWARRKLQRNISLNRFSNIVSEKIALSDADRKEKIAFKSSWPVGGQKKAARGAAEDIPLMRLDSYLLKHDEIRQLDVIKLDVDGYELKVIRGGLETLRRFSPVMVMELCAYSLKAKGDRIEEFVSLMISAGYVFYRETDLQAWSDEKQLIQSIPEDGSINVIAVPAGRHSVLERLQEKAGDSISR